MQCWTLDFHMYTHDTRMRASRRPRAVYTLENTIHYTGIRASFVQVAHVLRIINNSWQRRLRVPRARPHDSPCLLLCRKTDDYRYDMWRGDFHARLTPYLQIFSLFLSFLVLFRWTYMGINFFTVSHDSNLENDNN